MFRCLPGLLIGIVSMQACAAEHQWLVQEQFETFSLLADFHVDVQEIQKQLAELTSELNDALGIRPTKAGRVIWRILVQQFPPVAIDEPFLFARGA